MEKTTLRALTVLAIVLALGVGFYAGREVWPYWQPLSWGDSALKARINMEKGLLAPGR